MSANQRMSSSEFAYRAVVAWQESANRRASAWFPDTSNTQSTPPRVWGAFLGIVIAVLLIDLERPTSLITAPLVGMGVGWGIPWALWKAAARLTFVTLPRLLIGGIKKIVGGEPR